MDVLRVEPGLEFSISIPTINHSIISYVSICAANNAPPGTKVRYQLTAIASTCLTFSSGRFTASAGIRGTCDVINEINDGKDRILHCSCPHLSTYTGEYIKPGHRLLWNVRIEDTIRRPDLVIYNRICHILFVICALMVVCFISAICLDIKTPLYKTAHPFDDNHPNDRVPYVVEVTTGKRCGGGTTSTVAIKVFGTRGVSRVHLLKIKKYKTLQFGADDWFVLYTKRHLGHLTHVQLWHNNKGCSPDWYCNQVEIYDIVEMHRFKFEVEDWFTVGTRYLLTPAQRIYNSEKYFVENGSILFEHYLNECCNSHFMLGPFLKHRRFRMSNVEVILVAFVHFLIIACLAMYIMTGDFAIDRGSALYKKTMIQSDVVCILGSDILAFTISRISYCLFQYSKSDLKPSVQINTLMSHSKAAFTQEPDISKTSSATLGVNSRPSDPRLQKTAASIASKEKEMPEFWEKHRKLKVNRDFKEKRAQLEKSLSWRIKNGIAFYMSIPVAKFEKVRVVTSKIRKSPKMITALVAAWTVNILILATCFCYIGYTGLIWPNTTVQVWVLIVLFVLLVDVIVVEPLLIFLRSIICVYICGNTNIEIGALSSTSVNSLKRGSSRPCIRKIEHGLPPAYKPLLTEQLIEMQYRSITLVYLRQFLHYLFLFILLLSIAWFSYQNSPFIPNTVAHLQEGFSTHVLPYGVGLEDVRNFSKLLDYCGSTLFPAVERAEWYNGKPMGEGDRVLGVNWPMVSTRDYYNLLLGSPRVRMKFLHPESNTSISLLFTKYWTGRSYGYWNEEPEDTGTRPNFHEVGTSEHSWDYTETSFDATCNPRFTMQFYYSGGYIIQLRRNNLANQRELLLWYHTLKDDTSLRAVLLEFNIMNVNELSAARVVVLVEVTPDGFFNTNLDIEIMFPMENTYNHILRLILVFILFAYTLSRIIYLVSKYRSFEYLVHHFDPIEIAVVSVSLIFIIYASWFLLDEWARFYDPPLRNEYRTMPIFVHLWFYRLICVVCLVLCWSVAVGIHDFVSPPEFQLNFRVFLFVYLLMGYINILGNEVLSQTFMVSPVTLPWQPLPSVGNTGKTELGDDLESIIFFYVMVFTNKMSVLALIAVTVHHFVEEKKLWDAKEEKTKIKRLALGSHYRKRKEKRQEKKESRINLEKTPFEDDVKSNRKFRFSSRNSLQKVGLLLTDFQPSKRSRTRTPQKPEEGVINNS